MTREEIRRRIFNALNDAPEDPVYWSKGEVDDYIADAMEMLAEESEGLKRTFTIPRREGRMIYHLAGCGNNIIAPFRIWLPDLKRRLDAWSITDLDGRHEEWMTVNGDPWVWWPVDHQQFGIWPVPSTGGGWMEISCYVWPDELLGDGNRPEYMPEDHEALVQFGIAEGYLKQHMPIQAFDTEKEWMRQWGKAGSRSSTEQMASAFRQRGTRNGADSS